MYVGLVYNDMVLKQQNQKMIYVYTYFIINLFLYSQLKSKMPLKALSHTTDVPRRS